MACSHVSTGVPTLRYKATQWDVCWCVITQQQSSGLGRCCAGGDGEGYGAYYRSERTRALDDHFGDMLHKIHDLEARLAPCSACC